MLPERLYKYFHRLTSLNLSHNNINTFPVELSSHLTSIVELDLSYNNIISITGLATCKYLKILRLNNNRLITLEEKNILTSTSTNTVFYPALLKLNLTNNQLSSFTKCGPFNRTSLIEIDLSYNLISEFPILIPTTLLVLQLHHNQIANLSDQPIPLPKLKELTLGSNRIHTIPSKFFMYTSELAFLDVSNNQLKSINPCLSLKTLNRLDIRNNDLTTIPPELSLINTLNNLRLEGNPIKSIRMEIINKGTLEILKYLRTRLPNVLPIDERDILQDVKIEKDISEHHKSIDLENSKHSINSDSQVEKNQLVKLIRLGERNGFTWSLKGECNTFASSKLINQENSMKQVDFNHSDRAKIPQNSNLYPCLSNILHGNLNIDILHKPQEAKLIKILQLDNQVKLLKIEQSFLSALPNLQELSASNTLLGREPDSLFITNTQSGTSLKYINMEKCKFKIFPLLTSLSSINITTLILKNNKIVDIPFNSIKPLLNTLHTLDLSYNNITNFPESLLRCTSLMELYISNNKISSIEIIRNKIIQCQCRVNFWKSMQLLDLTNNDITYIPFELGLFSNTLKALKIDGNPIKHIRRSIIDKGTLYLLQYLKDKLDY